MKNKIRYAIFDRLRGKSFLEPVETSVCRIPEHLQELDSDVFMVFNAKIPRYEVHSLANHGNTCSFVVPWDILDERTVQLFRQYNLKTRSMKDIVREIDQHNDNIERRDEAYRRGEIRAWASENRSRFKKLAEEVF